MTNIHTPGQQSNAVVVPVDCVIAAITGSTGVAIATTGGIQNLFQTVKDEGTAAGAVFALLEGLIAEELVIIFPHDATNSGQGAGEDILPAGTLLQIESDGDQIAAGQFRFTFILKPI